MENLSSLDENVESFSSFIRLVEKFTPKDYMYMDSDSYYALHIFASYNEAQNSGVKNSVFNYINLTGSILGEKMLKSWLYKPLATIGKIEERQNTIECFADESSGGYLDELTSLMKNLGNIQVLNTTMTASSPKLSSWVSLESFLRTSIKIMTIIQSFTRFQQTVIAQQIIENVDINTLQNLLSRITKIIDFDSSKDWERVYVRDGVNKNLDDLRIKYNTLEEVLQGLAYDLGNVYKRFPNDTLNVVYIPQLGYLISIDNYFIEYAPKGWTEVFQTATTAYYKDETMEQMDEDYGDIYQLMVDYEIEIVYGLQSRFADEKCSLMLLKIGSLFAELDCFLSLTSVSILHDFVRPKMCEDPILFIEKGRHIIVEQSVPSFVPNDTTIPEHMLSIITGANSSGKSVYLTHIGIIVFLAHIGCYVPAIRATIGITDKILTRIVTREAIDKCESTFFIDLQNMSKCLSMCTPKSLMLIDEFGKGTDAVGGPSLLGAIIESLAQSEFTSRTIITTHFHELFKDGVLQNVEHVKHNHMDVVFTTQEQSSREKITYVFKLQEGLTTNSFGISCAEACGIPSNIIQRAREISEKPNKVLWADLDEENLKRAKHITHEFLLWDLENVNLPALEIRRTVETLISTPSSEFPQDT
jgi:DNA mismatch repair protein MSH5